MKIAVLSIALTLGVSLASASLSTLRERGKAAVAERVAPVRAAVKATPAKAQAKVEEKKAAAKATASSKVDEAKAAASAKAAAAKAAASAKADAAKATITDAAIGGTAAGGTVLGALAGTSDAGTTSEALASLPDEAKEALTSKFSAQQTILEQLSALKSGSGTASLDSLEAAVENYKKADSAWSLLSGQLPTTESSSVQSLFATSESIDSNIASEAAALLLENETSSTPGVADVLQLLVK